MNAASVLALTPEQTRIVEEAQRPIAISASGNARQYVILSRDDYERMRRLLEPEEVDPSFYECEEPTPHS